MKLIWFFNAHPLICMHPLCPQALQSSFAPHLHCKCWFARTTSNRCQSWFRAWVWRYLDRTIIGQGCGLLRSKLKTVFKCPKFRVTLIIATSASIKCTNNVTEIFPIKRYYFGFKNRCSSQYLDGRRLGGSTSVSKSTKKILEIWSSPSLAFYSLFITGLL